MRAIVTLYKKKPGSKLVSYSESIATHKHVGLRTYLATSIHYVSDDRLHNHVVVNGLCIKEYRSIVMHRIDQ